jgi:hypothetical protein
MSPTAERPNPERLPSLDANPPFFRCSISPLFLPEIRLCTRRNFHLQEGARPALVVH